MAPVAFQAIVFVDDGEDEDGSMSVDGVAAYLAAFAEEHNAKTAADSSQPALLGVSSLSDAMRNDDRAAAMEAFRSGQSSFLVCWDIAARGIDIPNTALVVQMSLPRETDTYLHRAGRTGRRGASPYYPLS